MPKVSPLFGEVLPDAQEMSLRRHAVNICAALPANHTDALSVLALARELVVDFLGKSKADG